MIYEVVEANFDARALRKSPRATAAWHTQVIGRWRGVSREEFRVAEASDRDAYRARLRPSCARSSSNRAKHAHERARMTTRQTASTCNSRGGNSTGTKRVALQSCVRDDARDRVRAISKRRDDLCCSH